VIFRGAVLGDSIFIAKFFKCICRYVSHEMVVVLQHYGERLNGRLADFRQRLGKIPAHMFITILLECGSERLDSTGVANDRAPAAAARILAKIYPNSEKLEIDGCLRLEQSVACLCWAARLIEPIV
jgi:hypothetical protein